MQGLPLTLNQCANYGHAMGDYIPLQDSQALETYKAAILVSHWEVTGWAGSQGSHAIGASVGR